MAIVTLNLFFRVHITFRNVLEMSSTRRSSAGALECSGARLPKPTEGIHVLGGTQCTAQADALSPTYYSKHLSSDFLRCPTFPRHFKGLPSHHPDAPKTLSYDFCCRIHPPRELQASQYLQNLFETCSKFKCSVTCLHI